MKLQEVWVGRLNGHSLAHKVAVSAHADLFAKGWSNIPYLSGQEQAVCLVSRTMHKICGMIVFEELEDESAINICLSYVCPSERRAGLFDEMWKLLVSHSKAMCYTNIYSGHHVNNKAMEAAMKKQRRVHEFNLYRYEVNQ